MAKDEPIRTAAIIRGNLISKITLFKVSYFSKLILDSKPISFFKNKKYISFLLKIFKIH